MPKLRFGLGRGIDALIPGAQPVTIPRRGKGFTLKWQALPNAADAGSAHHAE
jgi:hypothetical protein